MRDPKHVTLGGIHLDLLGFDNAVDAISSKFEDAAERPLGVASINLDHIHHFGDIGDATTETLHEGERAPLEWLNLVDGAPIATAARKITHHDWPRLAGSDLIGPLLQRANARRAPVGFLGGDPETHHLLRSRLADLHPGLRLAGCWSPSREELDNFEISTAIAKDIAAHGTEVLVVCLGKPRQELWIQHFGCLTGAHVLLAFGAVVDFLAGRVARAPTWVANHGLEWAWRLAREPRRLAQRYLVDGPPAYFAVRRSVASATENSPVRRAEFE